jgi:hypothetical protein
MFIIVISAPDAFAIYAACPSALSDISEPSRGTSILRYPATDLIDFEESSWVCTAFA